MNRKNFSLIVLMCLMTATSVWSGRVPRIVLGTIFDDKYSQGGYDYTYPATSTVAIEEGAGYRSKSALHFKLDANDYSGASICLYNKTINLKPHILTSALEFWVKGTTGTEVAYVGLLDEEVSDAKKVQSKVSLAKYGGITKEWRKVTIPLVDFPDRGLYWDVDKKTELPARIDWAKIAEFRLSSSKGENKSFDVYVDNIQFVKGTVKASKPKPKEVYWDEVVEKIDGPKNPADLGKGIKPIKSFYSEGFPTGGFTYVYGGKTAAKEQKSSTPNNASVLAMYLDDEEYSGVTISMGEGHFADLRKYRKKGGLYFWAKGKTGKEVAYIGLMDNQGNDIKVQTKVRLSDWGKLSTEWQLFKIPLKRFMDKGKSWDAKAQAEVAKDIRWDLIQEFRLSTSKGESNQKKGEPVSIYLDQITLTENIDWLDPDLKWDSFKSNAPDIVLHDFEKKDKWVKAIGPKSKCDFKVKKGHMDGKSLVINDYLLGDWVDVVNEYYNKKNYKGETDWTHHWGIMFDIYTDKSWQGITVQIGDAGRELFVANTGAPKGRHTLLIPFRKFNKFPYYQPPEAVQNGIFDLKGVKVLDFKPSGEGSRGGFEIDNVRLTNLRKVKVKKGPAEAPTVIVGNFKDVLTQKVNDGIFGINVALWDGDLLLESTEKQVKRVNHKIVRYPGGLRADDDHWQEVLKKKDFMVDTDEFLEWCKKTQTTPMMTVNFGKGTPEEAAAWVKYVNIDKKANVKYWEIGNELYGNWHPQHTTADDYGKRARKFIEAMKKVDPSIIVTVVWVLDGEWNKEVFKYTADIADGVNVHHYPQHYGEENDYALLAAPQDLRSILGGVRKATKEYGKKGKKYQIWLTEWNSVDFNPGPQTLKLVNGLFVADYLGMLATMNIDAANYWDVHNDVTPEGGDYGYLSRSYDEIGNNVPRPSYWAFAMASDALRGTLYKVNLKTEELTAYLTKNGKKKSLLVINKSKDTKYKTTLNIAGFAGKGDKAVLNTSNASKGPSSKKVTLKKGSVVEFPAWSITRITIE